MKMFAKFSILMTSMLFTILAFGGAGLGGGGFGKTRQLLQSFPYDQAFLTVQGSSSIPEGDTIPRLVIPADEYKDFVAEVEKRAEPNSEPYNLKVETEGGIVRNFTLLFIGEVGKGPIFPYLEEKKDE